MDRKTDISPESENWQGRLTPVCFPQVNLYQLTRHTRSISIDLEHGWLLLLPANASQWKLDPTFLFNSEIFYFILHWKGKSCNLDFAQNLSQGPIEVNEKPVIWFQWALDQTPDEYVSNINDQHDLWENYKSIQYWPKFVLTGINGNRRGPVFENPSLCVLHYYVADASDVLWDCVYICVQVWHWFITHLKSWSFLQQENLGFFFFSKQKKRSWHLNFPMEYIFFKGLSQKHQIFSLDNGWSFCYNNFKTLKVI